MGAQSSAASRAQKRKKDEEEKKKNALKVQRERMHYAGHVDQNLVDVADAWTSHVQIAPKHTHKLGWYSDLAYKCEALANNNSFSLFIIFVIGVAGIVVGMQTYDSLSNNQYVNAIDLVVLLIFIFELILKVIAEDNKPLRFFYGPDWKWNLFDFIIIIVSLPVWGDTLGGGSTKLLRLMRLMRVMKLVRKVPQLQMIVMGLIGGLKSIGYICLLLTIIFYVYAIAGIYAFRGNDDFHFGSLEVAMVTLFRAATLEDWTNIFYNNYYGCVSDKWNDGFYTPDKSLDNGATMFYCTNSDRSPIQQWIAVFYFISFIIISAFTMLALFIGAVTMSMTEAMETMKGEKEEAERIKILERARQKMSKSARSPNRYSMQGGPSISRSISKDTNSESAEFNGQLSNLNQEDEEEGQQECDLNLDEISKLQNLLDIAWGKEPISLTNITATSNIFYPGSFKFMYQNFANVMRNFTSNPRFVNFVTLIICIAGLLVGLQTYTFNESTTKVLNLLDSSILGIFSAEVLLKTLGHGFKPWRYFYYRSINGWNVFDYIVVAGSFLPGVGSLLPILRLLRLLRVLKLLRSLPQLRIIVEALIGAFSSISYIVMIICLVFYVFAILAMILFAENDPVEFGSLHISLFTLFRCATLEDWTDVMYINMYGCDKYGYVGIEHLCTSPQSMYFGSMIYFIIFIVIGALVLLTLFIGVVTTSMEEASDEQKERVDVFERVKEIQDSLNISDETIQVYKEVFATLDLDGGGTLDEDELALGFVKLNLPYTKDELKEMVALVDSDNSGEIDLAEFMGFMDILRAAIESLETEEGVRELEKKRMDKQAAEREALQLRGSAKYGTQLKINLSQSSRGGSDFVRIGENRSSNYKVFPA